jgi:spermidine/putrescine transport system permease protein
MPKKGSIESLLFGWDEKLLRLYVIVYLIYILLPLAILVLYAFNTSKYLIWPLKGLTLQWFYDAISDDLVLEALKNSLLIALATMFFSTVIGTMFAYGMVRYTFRGKYVLEILNILAIIIYGIVCAVSVLLWFRTLGISGGIWPTIIGHTTFIMPFAVLMVRDRLLNFDLELEEASMDLGANRLRTFFNVTLPLIVPAMLAAALFCFTISMGEFLLAFFLIGNDLTLPVYIFGKMRFTFTPAVNAVAAMIVAFPTLAVALAAIFFRKEVSTMY